MGEEEGDAVDAVVGEHLPVVGGPVDAALGRDGVGLLPRGVADRDQLAAIGLLVAVEVGTRDEPESDHPDPELVVPVAQRTSRITRGSFVTCSGPDSPTT